MKCFRVSPLLGMALIHDAKTAGAFLHRGASILRAVSLNSMPRLSSTSSSLHYMDSRNPSNEEEKQTSIHDNGEIAYKEEEELTLIPLSRDPLLLVSSKPLLTVEECTVLRRFFEDEQTLEGRALLNRVQGIIDELVGETNDTNSDDEQPSLPRFVCYPPRPLNEKVFPDGLHFDITPIMASLTFLLYLTTNDDGATAFPLASASMDGSSTVDTRTTATTHKQKDLIDTAQVLLDSGMTHTLDECQTQENIQRCKRLEMAGEDLYDRATCNDVDEKDASSTDMGIRVLPRAGRLCVFGNLLDNGQADPQSFHAGEGRNEHEKVLLTFFKEIPEEMFASRAEFEACAADTRAYMLERYYDKVE